MSNKKIQSFKRQKLCCPCFRSARDSSAKYLAVDKNQQLARIKGELVPIYQTYLYQIEDDTTKFLFANDETRKVAYDPIKSIKNDLERDLLDAKFEPNNCYIHPKNKVKIAWDIYVTM